MIMDLVLWHWSNHRRVGPRSMAQPEEGHLDAQAVAYAKENATGDEAVSLAIERLAVNLGKEIVSMMPGYVSTEVGAHTTPSFCHSPS